MKNQIVELIQPNYNLVGLVWFGSVLEVVWIIQIHILGTGIQLVLPI